MSPREPNPSSASYRAERKMHTNMHFSSTPAPCPLPTSPPRVKGPVESDNSSNDRPPRRDNTNTDWDLGTEAVCDVLSPPRSSQILPVPARVEATSLDSYAWNSPQLNPLPRDIVPCIPDKSDTRYDRAQHIVTINATIYRGRGNVDNSVWLLTHQPTFGAKVLYIQNGMQVRFSDLNVGIEGVIGSATLWEREWIVFEMKARNTEGTGNMWIAVPHAWARTTAWAFLKYTYSALFNTQHISTTLPSAPSTATSRPSLMSRFIPIRYTNSSTIETPDTTKAEDVKIDEDTELTYRTI